MKDEVYEIFGMRLKIVEDDGSTCDGCALQPLDVCRPSACMNIDGEFNRHFVKVEEYANKTRE